MNLASGFGRGRPLALGLAASLVLLLAAVIAAPVRATTPNLTGFWVNKADTRSGYTLRESKDASVLHADWAGLPPGHTNLRGHFQGTLDMSGDAYEGTFHVTEGSVSGSGHGTFALRSSFFASYPLIDVTLTDGSTSNFTLEIYASQPLLVPNGITEEITNPSPKTEIGFGTFYGQTGSNMSPDAGGTAQLPRASKAVVLGQTQFKIKPGKHRKITVLLNNTGRKLLKKRGSLKVKVVIRMSKSSGVPKVTKVGVVTIKK